MPPAKHKRYLQPRHPGSGKRKTGCVTSRAVRPMRRHLRALGEHGEAARAALRGSEGSLEHEADRTTSEIDK